MKTVRLTQTVQKGGCAAKLPAGMLSEFLADIDFGTSPELLVGSHTLDDACLWDLGDSRCLVQTLDFFTPIVDDPYDFGAIAAANALSDIYAMGGVPRLALTILAFPTAVLDKEVLRALMQGANDKIREAGAVIAGGHSIDDDTLKLGFSVTGFVEKNRSWTNAGARPGDMLILTKGLGVGTIVSAMKLGSASPAAASAAIASMKQLNDISSLRDSLAVHAATDITGFGLAGHAMHIAQASEVSLRIDMKEVPQLAGALDLLTQGIRNKAHRSNMDYIEARGVHLPFAADNPLRWLSVDPQTSGGLLLVVPKDSVAQSVTLLQERFPATAVIGEVEERKSQPLYFC
jgi:selenide,water dikinase